MPAIWLIDAYRAGERQQVRALVDALAAVPGRSCETIALEYRQPVVWPHVLGLASLAGVTAASRRRLEPPWPDLVVSCGVRNEPVCRWIRERSGGRTRYVHVGRPWGPLDSFDLVITTPQYRVPPHPKVLHNRLTLHGISRPRLERAAARVRDAVANLPAPRIAVAVGGNSGPYTFGPRAAARLGEQASALARASGGSLLVTTSSRTGPEASRALAESLTAPHRFHDWRAGDDGNPYLGFLALADRLIVTADSIAMLSEACATGKPVQMFDVGGMRGGSDPDPAPAPDPRDFRLTGLLYAAMMRWLWAPLSRDITQVHTALERDGLANWLGDEPLPGAPPELLTDLPAALARAEALLDPAAAVPVE